MDSQKRFLVLGKLCTTILLLFYCVLSSSGSKPSWSMDQIDFQEVWWGLGVQWCFEGGEKWEDSCWKQHHCWLVGQSSQSLELQRAVPLALKKTMMSHLQPIHLKHQSSDTTIRHIHQQSPQGLSKTWNIDGRNRWYLWCQESPWENHARKQSEVQQGSIMDVGVRSKSEPHHPNHQSIEREVGWTSDERKWQKMDQES